MNFIVVSHATFGGCIASQGKGSFIWTDYRNFPGEFKRDGITPERLLWLLSSRPRTEGVEPTRHVVIKSKYNYVRKRSWKTSWATLQTAETNSDQ